MAAAAPNPAILNGEVDWVYEEELDTRSNYFWSPDSKNLAFLQMNEENVPEYPITDWIPTHAVGGQAALSAAGRSQSRCARRRGERKGRQGPWVKVPIEHGQDYIPRFGWVDRKTLWVETLSRDHKHRRIYFADAGHGYGAQVLESQRRQVPRRKLRRVRGARLHRSHQLERRPQPYLSLQLRRGQDRLNERQAGEATDQGRFRSWRGLQRRSGAQGRLLRLKRRQSAGAAGLAGEL